MSALILRSEGDLLMVPSMLRNLLNAERVLLPGHVIITRCQSVSVEVFVWRGSSGDCSSRPVRLLFWRRLDPPLNLFGAMRSTRSYCGRLQNFFY